MQKAAAGDKQALKEIYEAYLPYLYTVVFGILQNKEDAEDVSTDVFLRIWETADRYRPGQGHKGYLATIARNMAIDHLRKRGREILVDDLAGAETDTGGRISRRDEEDGGSGMTVVSAQTDEESPVEKEVLGSRTIEEVLALLKPAERQIIDMKILSDMTFQEISDTLGIPMGTVTWRYREAIKKIRRCGYAAE